MNISVPDALADEVRQRNLPISSICQRALREEVDRRRRVEEADDILVYVESEQSDPDVTTWPGFVPDKPTLTYKPYPVGSTGRLQAVWVLEYDDGDGPCDDVTAGEPDDPPIDWAREIMREAARERERERGMEEITVDVGERALTVGFTGRWLVDPDPDETRGGSNAGAYWGIALTRRGRIAVYTAHVNDRWPAVLQDYDSLDRAANDDVPEHLIVLAAAELGEKRVLRLDI